MSDDKETTVNPMQVNKRMLYILQHMLGCSKFTAKRLWGWRNCFCANIGSPDHSILLEMERLGLVTRGSPVNQGRDQYFHVTREGARLCGLTKKKMLELFGKELT